MFNPIQIEIEIENLEKQAQDLEQRLEDVRKQMQKRRAQKRWMDRKNEQIEALRKEFSDFLTKSKEEAADWEDLHIDGSIELRCEAGIKHLPNGNQIRDRLELLLAQGDSKEESFLDRRCDDPDDIPF